MVIKHYLNGTEIDEPIGFDSLKMTMKRGEYHGMSAEVSEQTLEFYNTAADLIRAAYQTDLDTELTYRVTADEDEMYSGVLDLSTYEEQYSDYCSVSCKVGEVGVKTTFNNRADVEIDLNGTKTIDGKKLAHSYPWQKRTIPQRHILYGNNLITENDCPIVCGTNTTGITQLVAQHLTNFISLFPCKVQFNEYGELGNLVNIITGTYENNQNYKDIVFTDHQDMKLWEREYDEEWDKKFGNVSTHTIEADIKVKLKFSSSIFAYRDSSGNVAVIPMENNDWKMHCRLILVAKNTIIASGESIDFYDNPDKSSESEVGIEKTLSLKCSTIADINDMLFLGLEFTHTNLGAQTYFQLFIALNLNTEFKATILQGSYIKLQMFDNIEDDQVSADTMFVHEALNKVAESISENKLTVKSDLYSRYNSVVNPHTATTSNTSAFGFYFGDGALKAITNGYKIRGLYTTTDKERNMPMSFKTLVEALDAIDCIGWGFSEENGTTCVRVERWAWFYKTGDPILHITAPKEVKTAIDTSLIISELTIGYKKYTTSEDIASIDSIMSERTFTTSTKAVSQSVSKLCSFIADNYATELTRRAAAGQKEEEEFKYDENIFLFSLAAIRKNVIITGYTIDTDISTADSTILRPKEVYNAKLSPARNAYHWINRLFCVAGIKPFGCTSGTVNYKAWISTKETANESVGVVMRTTDSVNTIPIYTQILPSGTQVAGIQQNAENYTLRERYYKTYQLDNTGQVNTGVPSSDDVIIPRVFKAETISFTYPLSVAEYRKVKANPYGLIEVDGVLGWIKEFTYSFADGEATFKLIPKAD